MEFKCPATHTVQVLQKWYDKVGFVSSLVIYIYPPSYFSELTMEFGYCKPKAAVSNTLTILALVLFCVFAAAKDEGKKHNYIHLHCTEQ